MPTRDLVVMVPGVTGSVLTLPGRGDVWNLSWPTVARGAAAFARTVDLLRLAEGAPDTDGLRPAGAVRGLHLWPGFYGGPGYDRLLRQLTDAVGPALRVFSYDWRRSNRDTARLLNGHVRSWLDEWRRGAGGPSAKVVFVCHSMGGLVARYLIEVLGGRELTRRLVTLGTPYRGSVNAVRALTGDAFRPLRALGWDTLLTDVTRTFPALYELLPTYRCLDVGGGPATVRDVALPGLAPDAVASGLAFHDEIAAAVRVNGRPEYTVHAVAGKRQPTWQSVTVDRDGLSYGKAYQGRDYLGDGTVPLFSAVPPEWATTEEATCFAERHGPLTASRRVLDVILDKIDPVDLGEILAPPVELGLDVPEVAVADTPLPVVVTADRPDLLLHARLERPDRGEPVAVTMLRPDGHGRYDGYLLPPVGTWRMVVEAVAEVPPVVISDLVFVAPAG
ncbi:hypothetical protein AB0B74_17270 [Micromonospora parva]|uniref:esterase/lipase family protein n=1 Tax=Micromonospora parva TaxID=1464048 RepID=UPI0033ECC233